MGHFYQVRYRDPKFGELKTHHDHFAASLPFGAFAPAELYDTAKMQASRRDLEHFETIGESDANTAPRRQDAPTNILQVHTKTEVLTQVKVTDLKSYAVDFILLPLPFQFSSLGHSKLCSLQQPIEKQVLRFQLELLYTEMLSLHQIYD